MEGKWDSLNFGQRSIRNVVCVTFQVRGCDILATASRPSPSSLIYRMEIEAVPFSPK
jgi:hypothetical protein